MPKIAIDGLEMNPALNQENGSQHTVDPVWMSCPTGTPTAGRDDPPANGQNPHTCTLVPRNVGGTGITRHRLPTLYPFVGLFVRAGIRAIPGGWG
jgi:hypothetical protein